MKALDLLRAVRAMPRRPGLGATDKQVLMALIGRCDDDLQCWPSHAKLARDTWLGERTVRDSLRRLEVARIISVRRRHVADSSEADTNVYRIELDEVREGMPDVGHEPPQVRQEAPDVRREPPHGMAAGAGQVGRQLPGGMAAGAGEVPIEVPIGSAQGRDPTSLPLESDSKESGSSSEVRSVFDHWAVGRAQLTGAPVARMKLTNDRRRKIRARLREGYSVDELKKSIDGMLATAFNIEGGHTDVELACRDAAHVDRYMAAAKPPSAADGPTEWKPEPYDDALPPEQACQKIREIAESLAKARDANNIPPLPGEKAHVRH